MGQSTDDQPAARTTTTRIVAAMVLTACAAVIGVAAWLSPSDQGLGTHQQMGLAACGFYETSGWPCPTCGMTTAFSHVAHGNLIRGFFAQPAGTVFALIVIVVGIVAGYVLITGRSMGTWLAWHMTPVRIGVFVAALLLMGWAFKAARLHWHSADFPAQTRFVPNSAADGSSQEGPTEEFEHSSSGVW